MRLALRDRRFELATRALVVGVGASAATDLADLVELDGGAEATPAGRHPLVIRTACAADVAPECALVDVPVPTVDGDLVAMAARLGAGIVVTAPTDGAISAACDHLVAWARMVSNAGVPPDRIVVSLGAHRDAARLRATATAAALGYPVLVDLEPWTGDELIGAASLAVTRGARLLRTSHVGLARRVADTIAAVLEAA